MPGHSSLTNLAPRRILVRGVNWLGDAVMSTPALLRLRERFPDALIALVTPEKLRGLWLNHPAVDEIIGFKSEEGPWHVAKKIRVFMWPDTASRRNAGIRSVDTPSSPLRRGFDLAIVLPNSPRSALETWLARIPHRVGYARSWRKLFLTDTLPDRHDAIKMHKRPVAEIKQLISTPPRASRSAFQASAHQIHEYLHLAAALGANPEPVAPQIVVPPDEIKAVAQKFNIQPANNRPVLGLNPGAEYGPAKRWPADRFIAAAREIQKRTNCLWLVLGGKGDVTPAGEIASSISKSTSAVINLAGQTSLRELCAVTKLCRALLTNDTGPMHIAAALGIPVVVPFGSTSPELTGPIVSGNVAHQLIKSGAPCSPCFLRECPIDFRCMNSITIDRVVQAVLKAI
jgi:heptosyltransferase-2